MFKKLYKIYNNIMKISKLESNQARLFSLTNITKLLDANTFIPFTAWSLSPFVIDMVLNDILINKRSKIIEFGSGNSTIFIAKLIKVYDLDIIFFSVDSDQKWINKVKKQLKKENCIDKVCFIEAEIKDVSSNLAFRNQKKWYDTKSLLNSLPKDLLFDLVLVDAPWGGTTSYSRFSAIPFLKDSLDEAFSIYLDDIHRNEELEIAKEWSNILGLEYNVLDSASVFTKGVVYSFVPSYKKS